MMEKNKRTYSRCDIVKKVKIGSPPDRFGTPRPQSSADRIFLPQTPAKVRQLESQGNQQTPQSSPRLPNVDHASLISLEPRRMLNDTVVEFYMNYCLDLSSPSKRESLHLFSTFFYSKIKNSTQLNENDLDQLVKRWDKNVKLFDKDFLVVPICDHRHWLMVIICFANKVPAHDDPIEIRDGKVQNTGCLLIFDSLGYKYMSKFTEPIRNFLNFRWQFERPKDERPNFKDRSVFTECNAKAPLQTNPYDCGVYMLHSFEKFLQAPIPSYLKIREGQDLKFEWHVDTTQKRSRIKTIISNTLRSLPHSN